MNIIIAGAGKVGFNLAKSLSFAHNVTIIDKNSDALHRIEESLDVLAIEGDVEDFNTYLNLVSKEIDLFIAVTNIDSVNLVSTLMAESVLQIQRKFIRFQNHFFADSSIKERLQIDEMIFPTKLASQAIVSLLEYPKANNVKFFKYTDYKLISVRVSTSIDLTSMVSEHLRVVGIERDKNFFIPQERVKIQQNDLVYFFGLDGDIRDACHLLEESEERVMHRCVVSGGGELGVAIARALLDVGAQVKVIESNPNLCELADMELEGRASIINLKYGTATLYEDEGLTEADLFIAATNNDEYNIIKSLEAREHGIEKVLAINNELEYYNLMHALGIIVVRGPKISAYNTMMEHISSTGVVIQKFFCGAKAAVYLRKLFPTSDLIGRKLKPLKVEGILLFYIRDGVLLPFVEKLLLQEDDLIVLFCQEDTALRIRQWIYEL